MLLSDRTLGLLEESAAKGFAFLAETVPDFRDRIQVESIDLECALNCLLGQIYGEYFVAMDQLGKPESWAIEHGFMAPKSADGYELALDQERWDEAVEVLNTAWRRLFAD